MRHRHYTWIFLAALTAPFLLAGLFSFLTDPYLHYRPSTLYPQNIRYLAPALAKYRDYDTVVIGDSMSENFIPQHIARTIGGKGLNLSLSGSTMFEQTLTANAALRTGKPRRVIWALTPRAAQGAVNNTSEPERTIPQYLYDTNPLNDWEYLYNMDIIRLGWEFLFVPRPPAPPDISLTYTWFLLPECQPGTERVLRNYRRPPKTMLAIPRKFAIHNLIANFEQNMLATIRANRQVEFIVFVPPYSQLAHVTQYMYKPGLFQNEVRFLRHAFASLAGEPNVRLFFFGNALSITENLDNYKDHKHYWININEAILKAFALNLNRITRDNADAELDRFVRQVAAADINDLIGPPLPADADSG